MVIGQQLAIHPGGIGGGDSNNGTYKLVLEQNASVVTGHGIVLCMAHKQPNLVTLHFGIGVNHS